MVMEPEPDPAEDGDAGERRAPLLSLSGDLGMRARAAAHALAARLVDEAAKAAPRRTPTGRDDEALLFAQLALAEDDPEWARRAVLSLNAAIDEADGLVATKRFGLHGGLAGLGCTIEHISRAFGVGDAGLNADTDAALLRELERGRWRGACDLETGLVGFGIYFLERLPRRSAREGIALVLAQLEARSRIPGTGGLWQEGLELDVARGIPGLIHLLDRAAAAGIGGDGAGSLLARALEWRLLSGASAARSWSGDLGTAAVLFQVARRTGRADCRELASRLVNRCIDGTAPGLTVGDASVRSGAAGIAHALQRIHQQERTPGCLYAARVWVERALARLPSEDEPLRGGILDGAPGVALVLLSATTPVDNGWDHRILLSGPGPVA